MQAKLETGGDGGVRIMWNFSRATCLELRIMFILGMLPLRHRGSL